MSSDRSGGREPGRTGEGAASLVGEGEPLLRSVRVRRVIRSSHPPAPERPSDPRDVSGARVLPRPGPAAGAIVDGEESTETRAKKVTPVERPRRRRNVQTAHAGERQVSERVRKDTPAARPLSFPRRVVSDPLATHADVAGSAAGDSLQPRAERIAQSRVSGLLTERWREISVAVVLAIAAAVCTLLLR
jgi:hypothetical protein